MAVKKNPTDLNQETIKPENDQEFGLREEDPNYSNPIDRYEEEELHA